ncbi:MAG: hypothetical protein JNJ46_18910 [Myxococcales bacterium]|nr:hypothetical protein [Myxococcales bacterium]
MVLNRLVLWPCGALGWWVWLLIWGATAACRQPASSPPQDAGSPRVTPPLTHPQAAAPTKPAPTATHASDAALPAADVAAAVQPEERFATAQTPKLAPSQVCSRPVAEVPGMRVLGREHGYADYDKPFGCIAQSVWEGGALRSLADTAAAWIGPPSPTQSHSPDRGKAALRFIRLVYFAFEPVLDQPTAVFRRSGAPKFAAPRVETLRDGSLTATLFTQPSFPGPIDMVRRWKLRFAADGRLLEAVVLQQKTFDWHTDPEFLRSDGRVDK